MAGGRVALPSFDRGTPEASLMWSLEIGREEGEEERWDCGSTCMLAGLAFVGSGQSCLAPPPSLDRVKLRRVLSGFTLDVGDEGADREEEDKDREVGGARPRREETGQTVCGES